MNVDGTGVTALTHDGAYDPAWSPDGGRIAFASTSDGDPEIYVMNADGSSVTRLTTDPSHDWSPSWSPDGSMIAFESDRNGRVGIWVMDANGADVHQLVDAGCCPAWQPVRSTTVSPDPTATETPTPIESPPPINSHVTTTIPLDVPPNVGSAAIAVGEGAVWAAVGGGCNGTVARAPA